MTAQVSAFGRPDVPHILSFAGRRRYHESMRDEIRLARFLGLALCALLVAGCTSKKRAVQPLALTLAHSLRAADPAAFLRAHAQPGDVTPSGAYWLVTRAGGTRPDDTWNEEVLRSYEALRAQLQEKGADLRSIRLVDVEGVEIYDVDGDSDRHNLTNLNVRLGDGRGEYLLTFKEGMLAKRGWVLNGDLNVTVTRRK